MDLLQRAGATKTVRFTTAAVEESDNVDNFLEDQANRNFAVNRHLATRPNESHGTTIARLLAELDTAEPNVVQLSGIFVILM